MRLVGVRVLIHCFHSHCSCRSITAAVDLKVPSQRTNERDDEGDGNVLTNWTEVHRLHSNPRRVHRHHRVRNAADGLTNAWPVRVHANSRAPVFVEWRCVHAKMKVKLPRNRQQMLESSRYSAYAGPVKAFVHLEGV